MARLLGPPFFLFPSINIYRFNTTIEDKEMISPRRRCWEGIHPYHPHDSTAGLITMCQEFITKEMVGVELGSFRGASSEVLSHFCKSLTCVDPWSLAQEQRNYAEIDKSLSIKAEQEFNMLLHRCPNISKLKMFSDQAVRLFPDDSLDFVYIDAAHDEHNFQLDYNLWKRKVKINGIISGHDSGIVGNAIKTLNINIVKTYDDSSWISFRRQ